MRQTMVILGLVVLVSAGLLFYFYSSGEDEALPVVEVPPLETPLNETETSNEFSTDQQQAGTEHTEEALPAPLTSPEADDYLRETYEGEDEVLNELLSHDLILEKVTAAADALWRDENPTPSLNFLTPKQKLMVARRDGKWYLSEKNYARYAPFMAAMDSVDDDRLADTYLVLAPLLRSAHEALGNAHVSWDELVTQVIDRIVLMDVPEEPPELATAGKYYIFTDPQLEELPPAHKVLIRMGPQQAERFKKKLKGLRARLSLVE